MTFAGLAYNKVKVKAEEAPKTYQDINNPRWRNKISCKISSSGIQYVQWYLLRQIYGNDSGRSSPSSARAPSIRACSCSTASPRATTT